MSKEKDQFPCGLPNVVTAWETGYPDGGYNGQVAIASPFQRFMMDEKKKMEECEQAASAGCCSGISQCSQETNFLKYISGTDSGGFRRLFWLLVVMGAAGGLLTQVYRSTGKYVCHETNTKLTYVTRDSLDFPSVTICNTNMFRIALLSEYYGGWVGAYFEGLQDIRQMFPQLGITNEDSVEESVLETYPGNQNLLDFVLNSGHQIEDMLMLCEFNGVKCGSQNFTRIITNYGVCFTFNSAKSEKILSVKTPGLRQGLKLVLNAEETEVVAAPRENVGFKMLVHPRGEVPNLQDYGVELQPGTHTPVRLDVIEMTTLSSPYGNCGSQTLKYFSGDYTESKCYLECETDYIVAQCGCRNFYMPGNGTYCSPSQLEHCFYIESLVFAERRNLLCSCPEACHETLYKPTLSQTSFPSLGVGTTLVIQEKHFEIIAAGFGEAICNSASGELDTAFYEMYADVSCAVMAIYDTNGDLLYDLYPNTTDLLVDLLTENIFGNMQFDLIWSLSQDLLYEVIYDVYSMEVGSDRYLDEYFYHAETYLYSGKYKESVAEAFIRSGEYIATNSSQDFEDFVESVFENFLFDETFPFVFRSIYNEVYDLVISHGMKVDKSSDLADLTTQYMRKNLLHVDIFYGDLKVEQISEQPSYEVFQFICDLGGALGLFFGASILSFVETADFWFTRGRGRSRCGSKKEKETSEARAHAQPSK